MCMQNFVCDSMGAGDLGIGHQMCVCGLGFPGAICTGRRRRSVNETNRINSKYLGYEVQSLPVKTISAIHKDNEVDEEPRNSINSLFSFILSPIFDVINTIRNAIYTIPIPYYKWPLMQFPTVYLPKIDFKHFKKIRIDLYQTVTVTATVSC